MSNAPVSREIVTRPSMDASAALSPHVPVYSLLVYRARETEHLPHAALRLFSPCPCLGHRRTPLPRPPHSALMSANKSTSVHYLIHISSLQDNDRVLLPFGGWLCTGSNHIKSTVNIIGQMVSNRSTYS